MITLLCALAVAGVLGYLRGKRARLTDLNKGLTAENNRVHSLWNDLQYSSAKRLAKVNKHLSVATVTLQDIANQNHGQQTFEIWARKRATDAVAFIEKDKS